MADETPVPTCCQRMEMAGIIPQTLKQCPQDSLYLRLPGNVSDCAQVYHPLQVTSVIKISWKADPQSYYTLMLIGSFKSASTLHMSPSLIATVSFKQIWMPR